MKVFRISWNDPETVFHEMPWKKNFTVYPSLYSKSVKLKVGHVYGALETCAWLGIHINSELISLLWVFCGKKIAWRKCGGGGYSPLSPPRRCRRAWKDNRNCYKVGYFVRKWPISRVNICKIINSRNAKHSEYFKTYKPLFISVFPICMIVPLIETDMEKQ